MPRMNSRTKHLIAAALGQHSEEGPDIHTLTAVQMVPINTDMENHPSSSVSWNVQQSDMLEDMTPTENAPDIHTLTAVQMVPINTDMENHPGSSVSLDVKQSDILEDMTPTENAPDVHTLTAVQMVPINTDIENHPGSSVSLDVQQSDILEDMTPTENGSDDYTIRVVTLTNENHYPLSETEEDIHSTSSDSVADPLFIPEPSSSSQSSTSCQSHEEIMTENVNIIRPVNEMSVRTIPPAQTEPEKKLSRKRQRNPETWKKNKLKRLKVEGKEYTSNKGNTVRAKSVQHIVCKCHYKCIENFTIEQRTTIFKDFMSLENDKEKWTYITNNINKEKPKRRYVSQDGDSNRKPTKQFTLAYHLTYNEKKHRVCKQFFLKTLDISGKKVETAMKKKTETGVVIADQRGKKPAWNKISEETVDAVRDHIKCMPVMESHYCRSETKRKYLPSNLSENRLYKDYLEYCKEKIIEPVKPSFYKHIFRTEFNYGFYRPKKDMCDYCTQFKNMTEEEKKCAQDVYNLHQTRKNEAREHKKVDKARAKEDSKFRAYTMDMEKILLSPQLQVGQLYYKKKLKTFNFTLYELARGLAINFMWHEGNGSKGSSEIATCLWDHLMALDSDVTEVTFYSDTAGGQNRNSIVAAMFLRALEVLPNLTIINQKFMESGHSDMECDSVHSAIENRSRKIDIFSLDGWYTVVRTAKITEPLYKVREMNYNQFMNFKAFSEKLIRNKNAAEGEMTLNWLKVKWLQYRKLEPDSIYFKNQLSQEEFSRLFIRTKTTRATRRETVLQVQQLYKAKRRIDAQKLQGLQEMCRKGTIPCAYHEFYMKTLDTEGVQSEQGNSENDD